MKVFVAFEGLCESFDIFPEDTVKDVKLMIKDYFHVPLSEDKQGRRYLELIYAGAKCLSVEVSFQEEDKPVLYVYNTVTHEKVPIMGKIYLLSAKVSQLKTMVTLKCGFPNSIYCLRTPEGREMYDCNILSDYQLDIGTSLHLDVWDGWKEFLTGCLLGNKHKVQHYLSKEKPVVNYQKRVALYLAAFCGHLQLSAWLLKQGARPTEAVGVHPYREWCQDSRHPDVAKCPVHAAAEAGQLMMLKAFVNYSILCLECQTSAGQTPLQLLTLLRLRRKGRLWHYATDDAKHLPWEFPGFGRGGEGSRCNPRLYVLLEKAMTAARSELRLLDSPRGNRDETLFAKVV
uniref:Protein ankub1 n=1 Tax=Sphaerodactylus townsendi TaxID=933632 RepID=A0ACB8FAF5_9SAUR